MPGRSRRSRAVALVAVVLAPLALILATAGRAAAHAGNQSYLYLDIAEESIGGRIEVPLRDLNAVLDVAIAEDDDSQLAELLSRQDDVVAYLDQHLDIGADGEVWPLSFQPAELFYSDLPEEDDNYILYFFTADIGDRTVPRTLDVTFDPFVDEFEGRDSLLLIANDWAGGVIENGHDVASAFDAGSRTQSIDLGATGWWRTVGASAELGINHIRTGPDHVLFVLVLLLPSVLVFTTAWRPTPSFGAALWRVLKIVSMFTLAHSITFTLAGLELLPTPSPKIVESIIAISIAATAVHNLRPLAPNREWLIAFGFGLFHGMGFASLIESLDVPRSTQLISLLGRNLGIEIGQAAVVILLFPGLYLLRRTRWFQGFFLVLSIVLAVVSIGWMIERLFETDLGVSAWVEPVVDLPQGFIVAALFTLVAAGVHAIERAGDRLLPVHLDAETVAVDGPEPAGVG